MTREAKKKLKFQQTKQSSAIRSPRYKTYTHIISIQTNGRKQYRPLKIIYLQNAMALIQVIGALNNPPHSITEIKDVSTKTTTTKTTSQMLLHREDARNEKKLVTPLCHIIQLSVIDITICFFFLRSGLFRLFSMFLLLFNES